VTVRRLDENGDIVTSGVQFITEREEIAQTIQTRLRLFLGEYFRNSQEGTPWFQDILGKGSTLTNKDAAIKRRIIQTPGVLQILTYDADYDINTRKYTVNGSALTTFGEVVFNG
tara:strand:- start:56 stop:397 length:342 start_codon:yes stop_codon:yes gene_type:complete